jgi:hypothetical protein
VQRVLRRYVTGAHSVSLDYLQEGARIDGPAFRCSPAP